MTVKTRIESGITSTGDIVRMLADEIHGSGGGAMISLAPLSAIVPSAVVLYGATSAIFGTVASLALALGIESTGFAAAKIGVDKSKATGKARWAVGMVSVYVVITMLLLGGLKVAPVVADPAADAGALVTALGQMLLPLLAVLGAIIYAMGTDMSDERKAAQAAREQAQADRYDELRWQREQAEKDAAHKRELDRIRAEANAQAKLAKVSRPVSHELSRPSQDAGATSGGTLPQEVRWDKMIDLWRDNPHMPQRDIARILGVGKSTVHRDKKELEAAGVIHVNGNGVEILR